MAGGVGLKLRPGESLSLSAEMTEGCPKGMAYVAGGTFTMGSEQGEEDEKPLQQVTVAPFCIDRLEALGTDQKPMRSITWAQARQACSDRRARLPTEAEWEFAARGVEGRLYPWGGDEPTCDRSVHGGCTTLAKSGKLESGRTPEGVLDLAGSVWEWTGDVYAPYGTPPAATGPRVMRGGSYRSKASVLRATNRHSQAESYKADDLGYRCAREPPVDLAKEEREDKARLQAEAAKAKAAKAAKAAKEAKAAKARAPRSGDDQWESYFRVPDSARSKRRASDDEFAE